MPQDAMLKPSLVRKREKFGKCPVWERGGDAGRAGRGGPARSGAQDKPTFLNTPGVVLAGAKQPELRSAYMAATWLRHSNCTSVPRCEEHPGTPV